MKNVILLLVLSVAVSSYGWTHVGSNLFGWNTKTLVFSVNHTNCTLPNATINDILDSAMNTWNGIPGTDLTLSRSSTESTTTPTQITNGTATDAPVIVCDPNFSTNVGDANRIIGVSTGTRVDSGGHINFSGVILNAQSGGAAEISQLSRTEVEIAIAHEIGHVLGLGHSSSSSALMYYSVGNKPKAMLIEDDMDGITHLYPRNEFKGGSFGCATIHIPNSRPNYEWASLGIFLILINIYFGRRFSKNQT